MSTASSASVRNASKIGLQANFVKRGLSQENIRSTTDDTTSQNKLPLFRQTNILSTVRSKFKLLLLKFDFQLYASPYMASQAWETDLDEFFAPENHAYPVPLFEYGKLR